MKARITINDTVVLDDDLEQWNYTPPEALADLIKPGTQPEPHLKALLITLADAALTQRDTRIDITTDGASWTLTAAY